MCVVGLGGVNEITGVNYEECVVGGEWAWDECVPHAL